VPASSDTNTLPNEAVISNQQIITLKFLPYTQIERQSAFGNMTIVAGVDASYDPRGANICGSLTAAAQIVQDLIALCQNNPSFIPPLKDQAASAVLFLQQCAKNEQIRVDAIKALIGTVESYDTPSI
jgi:hypothetical protein